MNKIECLMEVVQKEFVMPVNGSIHGLAHWLRVLRYGLRLAESTGANPQVVELFALLHDCKRMTDWPDPEHGHRAAEFAATLRGSLITLPDGDFERLAFACEHHTEGLTEADVTVQTCWDADRLDLWRVGIEPHPARLCTPAARQPEIIEWALAQSRQAVGEPGDFLDLQLTGCGKL